MDDHRLREQRERDRYRDDEACAPAAVEAEAAGGRERVEGDADTGERELPAAKLLSAQPAVGPSSGGSFASEKTPQATNAAPRAPRVTGARRRMRPDASGPNSIAESAANAEATTSPIGVASSK